MRREQLLNIVAEVTTVPKENITEGDRSEESVYARHLLFYMMHRTFKKSKSAIGRAFRYDRTSVLYAIRKIEELQIQETKSGDLLYPEIANDIKIILNKIKSLNESESKVLHRV